jgi:hypothetical protein
MAEEYIKKSSGLMPIGNTQGLMIPQDLPFHKAIGTVPAGTIVSGDQMIPASSYTIPEDGLYFFSATLMFNESATLTTILFYVNGTIQYLPINNGDTRGAANFYGSVDFVDELTKGTVVTIGCQASSAGNTTAGSWRLTVVKLQNQVPDFVANKGALVSNPTPGGVTFNLDGLLKMYLPSNNMDINGIVLNQTNGRLQNADYYSKRFICASRGSVPAWYKWMGKGLEDRTPDFMATIYGFSGGAATLQHRGLFDLAFFRQTGLLIGTSSAVLTRRSAALGTASLAIGYDDNDDLYLYTSGQYMTFIIELFGIYYMYTSYADDNGRLPDTTTAPSGWTVLASV